jgi:hypothetical protein
MGGLIHLPSVQIQPQQPTDPLDQYAKLLSVQRLSAQQGLQQAQIQNAQLDTQSKQLEVAQQQRDAQDQQTMRSQAPNFVQKDQSGKITGYDTDGYFNSLLSNGVSPIKIVAMRQQQAQSSKAISDAGESAIKLADAKNDNAYNILEGVRAIAKSPQAGPNTTQGAYVDALGQLQKLGVDTSKYPQQFSQVGDQGLQQFEAQLGLHKQIINDAQKQAEIGKNTSAQTASDVETQIKTLQLDAAKKGGVVPGVPLENQEATDWLSKNPGKTLADYQKYAKTLVPAFNFNLQAGGVGGSGKTPTNSDGTPQTPEQQYASFGSKQGVVKAIVEGRQTAPGGFAQKTPYWQDVMQKVYQVDPQWNEQRAQVRKDFTIGPDGKNIGALNTATVHLDALDEASKALDNGTLQPGNAIFNKVKTAFGAAPPTTFEGLRNAVAGEMASALKGNATDPEIAQIKSTISQSSSPKQLSDLVNSQLGILGQKLQTYKERYEQQNPNDTVYSPVLPSAAGVYAKHGITPGQAPGASQTQQAGASGKFVSLAAAKQLPAMKGKSDAEIESLIKAQGHTVAP